VLFALADEFSLSDVLALAEDSFSSDWRKGLIIIEAARTNHDTPKALEYCRKTVESFCKEQNFNRESSPYDPVKKPLFNVSSSELIDIFQQWQELARSMSDVKLAELLGIQLVFAEAPDDWTAVKQAFKQELAVDISLYFQSWKEYALRNYNYSSVDGETKWIEWLIDAGFSDTYALFTKKAVSWLQESMKKPKNNARLSTHYYSRKKAPQLGLVADVLALKDEPTKDMELKAVLKYESHLATSPSRLEWLGNTDIGVLYDACIAFIKMNMDYLIRSPDSMSGDYSEAADWMLVADEMVPEKAKRILCEWKVAHKRRRNLWRDLRLRGFTV